MAVFEGKNSPNDTIGNATMRGEVVALLTYSYGTFHKHGRDHIMTRAGGEIESVAPISRMRGSPVHQE